MRNRAKCKKCQDIIESFHRHDYVTCKCGEIAIDGGNDLLRVVASDFSNFLRVDDEGNEIVVAVKGDISAAKPLPEGKKISRKDLVDALNDLAKSYENLPSHAMHQPISHGDFASFLAILAAALASD